MIPNLTSVKLMRRSSIFISNMSFGMQTVQYNADDALPESGLSSLVPMLDDLRRLGEIDLKMNHPQAGKK